MALDLRDLLLVDREAVKLLAFHESNGEPNSEAAGPISVNGSRRSAIFNQER